MQCYEFITIDVLILIKIQFSFNISTKGESCQPVDNAMDNESKFSEC